MSTPRNKSGEGPLSGIQCLRALAAMMVVWVHAREQFDWLSAQFPSTMGAHGVDLFFVISGLIMVVSTKGKPVDLRNFLWRRFIRIAPLYWLATAALLAIALTLPSMMKSTVVSWPHVLGSFLFFPVESPGLPGKLMPLLVPGWTLNYEMFFYLLFGTFTFFFLTSRSIVILIVLAGLSIIGWFAKLEGVLGFYCDPIVFTFGFGIILGEALCRKNTLPHGPLISVGLFSLGAMLFVSLHGLNTGHRIVSAGIPAAIIVLGVLTSPLTLKWPVWLIQIGDSSYSLYLTHIFVLGVLRALSRPIIQGQPDPWMGWAFMGVALAASVCVGYVVHRFIELPLTAKLHRVIQH